MMPTPEQIQTFEREGLLIVPTAVDQSQVAALRNELEQAMNEDLVSRPDVFDSGMVHNCMFRGKQMAAFLDNPVLNTFTQSLLAPSCIMYAYQSSSAPAGGSNYGSRIHVDCPRFIPNYRTNIGVILALDDFRPDNGGTRYLKGSHLKEEPPSEQFFNENCSTATCSAGDMIIFNARLYHATGVNNSSHIRHALTINFCRCFMRQRFDFCNMEEATPDFFSALGEDGKRLMGYNVRTPKTLDEFYLPEKHRLYKPGQE